MATKLKKKRSLGKKLHAAKSKRAKSTRTSKASKSARAAGTDPERVTAILAKLDEAYANATCELKHENAFQLLISTILSAQCTDVRVNQVAETLYKKYPDAKAFAYATPSELEQDIRPTGFFRNKTKSVMGASKAILEKFGGQVPRTMEEILTLPGVARKLEMSCSARRTESPAEWWWILTCCASRTAWICRAMKTQRKSSKI
jgi:endonuclease-3